MNAVIFFAVVLTYIGIIAVQHAITKAEVKKARKTGFLEGYRKCATARRTITKPYL